MCAGPAGTGRVQWQTGRVNGRPPAFVFSFVCGVVGIVLILVGLAVKSTPVDVVGSAAGAVSLIAALYWRSQLIADWHEKH
jgi:hypothetical protein